jgi:hypothetical protein
LRKKLTRRAAEVSRLPLPLTYEGLPSDWYLKLTGAATKMIRGEAPHSEKIPQSVSPK